MIGSPNKRRHFFKRTRHENKSNSLLKKKSGYLEDQSLNTVNDVLLPQSGMNHMGLILINNHCAHSLCQHG